MIGALRNRIELLTATRIADGGGGAAIVWLPGPELWAAVERLASTQSLEGGRRRRLKRIAATIRERNDIPLGARISFEGETWEVVSLEEARLDGRRLTLICEEVPS